MGDLFRELRNRLDANARRAVEVYARELAEYRMMSTGPGGRTSFLDFAVILRRRMLTLDEIQDAAGPNDLDALMLTLGWLAPQGVIAQNAYSRGYMEGQEHYLPL